MISVRLRPRPAPGSSRERLPAGSPRKKVIENRITETMR
jgi:hypothetical protein